MTNQIEYISPLGFNSKNMKLETNSMVFQNKYFIKHLFPMVYEGIHHRKHTHRYRQARPLHYPGHQNYPQLFPRWVFLSETPQEGKH